MYWPLMPVVSAARRMIGKEFDEIVKSKTGSKLSEEFLVVGLLTSLTKDCVVVKVPKVNTYEDSFCILQ